mmetsp:Transcript_23802/g.35146  ORF Transcript_23802/g.35146 Transcript_23802/m.35146 type:complete len:241 (-) Transcript_23802:205-927(-)
MFLGVKGICGSNRFSIPKVAVLFAMDHVHGDGLVIVRKGRGELAGMDGNPTDDVRVEGGHGKGRHPSVGMTRHKDPLGIDRHGPAQSIWLRQCFDRFAQEDVALEALVVGIGRKILFQGTAALGGLAGGVLVLQRNRHFPRQTPTAIEGHGRISNSQGSHVRKAVYRGQIKPARHGHLKGGTAPHSVDVDHHWEWLGCVGSRCRFGHVDKDAAVYAHVLNGDHLKGLFNSQILQRFHVEA